ncbi:MAG: starch-binding protein [Lachnospiraceae bacterium]|nr:starch-binding protein [Lachnospiraceae bacterium]
MRKFKKALAVVSAAVMTMAMSVTAFADQTVTYHFYNAKGWDNVGAWVKQSIDWSEDCMPTDKCILKDTTDGTEPHEPIWPGAIMEAEGGNWYKITVTYTAPEKGSMMIFNNYVGDSTPGDTTSEADIQKLKDAGVVLNDVATKEQTQNIMIKKNGITANAYWIKWDGDSKGAQIVLGKSDMITDVEPAEYTNRNAGSSTDSNAGSSTDNNAGSSTDNNAGTTTGTTNNNAGTTTGTTNNNAGTTTNNAGTKAPTTGDSAAVSVVLLGLASAVAVVAAKKKVNA